MTDEEKIKQLTERLNKKLKGQQETESETNFEDKATDIIKEHKKPKRKEEPERRKKEEQKNGEVSLKLERVPDNKLVKYVGLVLVLVGLFIAYHMIMGKSKEEKYGAGVERLYEGMSSIKKETKGSKLDIYSGQVQDVGNKINIIEKMDPISKVEEGVENEEVGYNNKELQTEEAEEIVEKKEEILKIKEEEKTEAVKEAQELLDLGGVNKLGDGLK